MYVSYRKGLVSISAKARDGQALVASLVALGVALLLTATSGHFADNRMMQAIASLPWGLPLVVSCCYFVGLAMSMTVVFGVERRKKNS